MKQWSAMDTFIILLMAAAMPVVSWMLIKWGTPLGGWISAVVLAFGFVMMLGKGIVGSWFGILIDDRNVFSLSRLQMTLWGLLIVPSLLVIALSNAALSARDALDFVVPAELWILMGISTVSFVG